MNNSLFISRCQTVLTTMESGNQTLVTAKKVAAWLEMEESAASQVVAKICKAGLLEKTGAGRNTCYQTTEHYRNSLRSALSQGGGDVIAAVKKTVDWFINKKPVTTAKEIVTINGRKLVKIDTKREMSSEAQQAVDDILRIIKLKDELQAENELLREEIERLKKYEEYYKSVKDIKL